MPELSIVYARVCASNHSWEKSVKGSTGTYKVKWGPDYSGRYAYGWSCTCPAFKFSKARTCKHIEAAKSERCGWGHEAYCGSFSEPNPDGSCPKCGGPTEVVKVGV